MPVIIPPHIEKLTPYVPGRLIEEVEAELGLTGLVKLASNENSLGPSPMALAAMARALPQIHRYSDADCRLLRAALSRKTGCDPAQIICGNGSSEFILLLAHVLTGPGDRVLMSRPSFTLYAKNAQAAGAEVVEVPLAPGYGHDLAALLAKAREAGERTRLVFLDNPLNPTGAFLSPEALTDFYLRLPPDAVLVLDEAYIDFCRKPRADWRPFLAEAGGRLVVLRTFSKIYGLAGLRAAYALMPAPLAAALNKARQPFNMNSLAQAGALAALEDEDFLRRSLSMTWISLDYFQAEFARLGLDPRPTEANYLMAGLGGRSADEFFQALLHKGVITRSLTSFGLPTFLRVNAGLPAESRALVSALEEVLAAR
ncbi:MAG: histidinol-phosphate transaminase [Candidatus Adiutrix sp.]|jgi:histidinol-phosphate aminotransferase|nr:histidinol-phosphate transaminase [Candidatus Adiutrix sp.]